ncbi:MULTISPECIES: hypothetical protein [Paenarthrobacter]|uniref:Transposase n=1 Tax=Paenarthrobacter ureafaciens TaxID=37931 RepID=A0AAX3EPR9_PAEUR|nr:MULTISPECIES: hypothetical protein [Paenarthrobacter]MDO5867048.1 hypothetical protein [Paenarthrobacter sp. SD-2]MDO5878215.1 hypothetical protein [Paenarthrobacter sp. SD-1]UYV95538.1 hypothetical protein NL395_22960 [Paenarthrobacter ureafaciens]UYW00138.1 hypothetical protein NL394_23345 [Paenarthrobacter ureafaciens]
MKPIRKATAAVRKIAAKTEELLARHAPSKTEIRWYQFQAMLVTTIAALARLRGLI